MDAMMLTHLAENYKRALITRNDDLATATVTTAYLLGGTDAISSVMTKSFNL